MGEQLYENRELSWLRFNERVLEESEDERTPLCERLSFVSIYQTNLDEFFMVRVGSLHDEMLLDDEKDNKTNMKASKQLEAIKIAFADSPAEFAGFRIREYISLILPG